MGDYSDEDALIEVQLPDTTQDAMLGREGVATITDASRLSWSMTEAEMIKLAEKEEQDLIKSSKTMKIVFIKLLQLFLRLGCSFFPLLANALNNFLLRLPFSTKKLDCTKIKQ